MPYWWIIFIASLALSGCTTSEQATQKVTSRFAGRPADEFFVKNGPPSTSYNLRNGDTLYTWQERARFWRSSGSVNTTVIGNTAYSTVSPGQTHLQQCQLKIVVSSSGLIKEISVLSDSLGVWQLSRCNEFFGRA